MYQGMFGCEVEFGAKTTAIFLDRDYMMSRIATSNETVRNIKETQCKTLLEKWHSELSIEEQITNQLIACMPIIPSLECMAEKLYQSRSTLSRKLRDSNTTYQIIVDDFRRDMALDLLNNTDLTICEVAEKVGFSDDSNFRRAFKKWTGIAPSDIRGSHTQNPEGTHSQTLTSTQNWA